MHLDGPGQRDAVLGGLGQLPLTFTHRHPRPSDTLFSDDAIGLIHNASRGHPRAVNNLALHALTAAFAAEHAIVDENAARIAISENAAD